jgi:hypothetical protein
MRWVLVIALVVWFAAVVMWVHRYGARSYLKLAAVLVLGALVALVGFLLLDRVWWAFGGLAAILAGMAMLFGVIYVLDRRKVEAYEREVGGSG